MERMKLLDFNRISDAGRMPTKVKRPTSFPVSL
jgi:hypothetical protein